MKCPTIPIIINDSNGKVLRKMLKYRSEPCCKIPRKMKKTLEGIISKVLKSLTEGRGFEPRFTESECITSLEEDLIILKPRLASAI